MTKNGNKHNRSLSRAKSGWLRNLSPQDFHFFREVVKERTAKNKGLRGYSSKALRKLKRRRKAYQKPKVPPRVALRSYRESELLAALYPGRSRANWIVPVKRKKIGQYQFKYFSFLDNPQGTMDMLGKIAKAESFEIASQIDFDDDVVNDVGPYLLLGIMRRDMLPFLSGGNITRAIAKVLEVLSIDQFMSIKFDPEKDKSDVWPLRLRERQPGDSETTNLGLEPSRKEKVASDLTKAVNKWLLQLDPPFSLTDDGKANIGTFIGEILDNAETHGLSGTEGGWAISGFMARRVENDIERFVCHLAILGIGRPIYESIDEAKKSVISKMKSYVGKHKLQVSPKILKTLFALQDGISRKKEPGVHGTGCMEMIEMVSLLGLGKVKEPAISIISGSTCILLRNCDIEHVASMEPGKRRVWGNSANSPDQPPIKEVAFSLKQEFPGTIISVRFELDADYLASRVTGNGTDNKS